MKTHVTYPQRIRALAKMHPSVVAIHDMRGSEARSLTWKQYADRIDVIAGVLAARGIRPGSLVGIALPNGADHLAVAGATWALGATVLPLCVQQPAPERSAILRLAQPALVAVGDDSISSWRVDVPDVPLIAESELVAHGAALSCPDEAQVPVPGVIIATGGSTGRPKLIVTETPWVFSGDGLGEVARAIGMRPTQTQLVAGPLYHTSPFHTAHHGLVAGHTLVVMTRFEPDEAIRLVEHHRVQFTCLVPTMMRRMLGSDRFSAADLSTLQAVYHTGGSCPPWVKRAWIDRVGPDALTEAYGGAEGVGSTVITGREWLERPGSVGRPINCELTILDDDGNRLPSGRIGSVYLRPSDDSPAHRYIGSPPAPTTPDGYVTIGDLGLLDKHGYLYLADRRVDLIVTGGANVYPAEVEHVLAAHPAVEDVAVIGIGDDEWGQRVHAVVQVDPRYPEPAAEELNGLVRAALSGYKAPKSYEFVARLPRDEAGKLRRADLRAARAGGRHDETIHASWPNGAPKMPHVAQS